VRDGDVEIGGRHGNRQLLEAIAADHHHVGRGGEEAIGELERGEAGGLGHRHVVAALDDVEQRRLDLEPARGNVVGHVPAVLVEQDRAAEHQLQVDVRMRVQLADQELAAAVVGAAGNRKADFSLRSHPFLIFNF
jgi:hypothetical protein